jgi:predicted transcriptional regulator YheO
MTKADKELLTKYAALGEFISKAMIPFAEVVIHDVRKPSFPIFAIFNAFTGRKKGTPTNVMADKDHDLNQVTEPVHNIKWISETNNKPVKTSTMMIRNNKGKLVGAMSINLNLEHFENLRLILDQFANFTPAISMSREDQQFQLASKNEIKKIIMQIMHEYHIDAQSLSRKDKLEVVRQLFRGGHFLKRGMVTAVSDELKLTRATIYAYIRKVKSEK